MTEPTGSRPGSGPDRGVQDRRVVDLTDDSRDTGSLGDAGTIYSRGARTDATAAVAGPGQDDVEAPSALLLADDDALLDAIGGRRPPAAGPDGPVEAVLVGWLTALAVEADTPDGAAKPGDRAPGAAQPVDMASRRRRTGAPRTHGGRHRSRRSALATAAALAVTASLSLSGVAAAVTGDALAPYRSVLSQLGVVLPPSPGSPAPDETPSPVLAEPADTGASTSAAVGTASATAARAQLDVALDEAEVALDDGEPEIAAEHIEQARTALDALVGEPEQDLAEESRRLTDAERRLERLLPGTLPDRGTPEASERPSAPTPPSTRPSTTPPRPTDLPSPGPTGVPVPSTTASPGESGPPSATGQPSPVEPTSGTPSPTAPGSAPSTPSSTATAVPSGSVAPSSAPSSAPSPSASTAGTPEVTGESVAVAGG